MVVLMSLSILLMLYILHAAIFADIFVVLVVVAVVALPRCLLICCANQGT